jgi:hypothetical protein
MGGRPSNSQYRWISVYLKCNVDNDNIIYDLAFTASGYDSSKARYSAYLNNKKHLRLNPRNDS